MMNEKRKMSSEQRQLYHDIGVISFVIVEMTEYLDTHPTDRDAMHSQKASQLAVVVTLLSYLQ